MSSSSSSSDSEDNSGGSSSSDDLPPSRSTRNSPKKEARKSGGGGKKRKRGVRAPNWSKSGRGGRKLNKKGGKQVAQSWDGFSFAATYRENHQKPLYGVAFSPFVGYKEDEDPIFATVGSNRATIYRCPRDKQDLDLLQCYEDDETEEFFCCTWLYDTVGEYHLLAVGGERGIIRIIAPETGENVMVLSGHGKAINEMRTHPIYPEVMLSAGRDWRVKIWHGTCGQCILMVGGASPHTDEVLSADFDTMGRRVVTGSMDHFIKIWDLKDKLDKQVELVREIQRKKGFDFCFSKLSPLEVNFPQVVTNDVHTNYVDCARFFVEDFLITKSCEEQICIWKVGDEGCPVNSYHHTRPETNISTFRILPLPDSDVWFMKFVVDPTYTFLASGDIKGKIKLWPVGKDFMKTDEAKPKVLQHRLMRRCVRQLDFSPKGEFLVAVCDDASVWRWDRNVEVLEEKE